ncbi:MAG: cysteine methyltransferase [Gammaproteobacteria bacterium]|nr:cysteine methyltransferase [Gammaproteobacteria bacterium]
MITRRQVQSSQSGGDGELSQPSPEERIWQVISLIPSGRVASYGQVAELAGMPNHARFVGRTLSKLPPESKLPWHRVVNASLRISLGGPAGARQRKRLTRESVQFVGDRIASTHRWEPG